MQDIRYRKIAQVHHAGRAQPAVVVNPAGFQHVLGEHLAHQVVAAVPERNPQVGAPQLKGNGCGGDGHEGGGGVAGGVFPGFADAGVRVSSGFSRGGRGGWDLRRERGHGQVPCVWEARPAPPLRRHPQPVGRQRLADRRDHEVHHRPREAGVYADPECLIHHAVGVGEVADDADVGAAVGRLAQQVAAEEQARADLAGVQRPDQLVAARPGCGP